MEPPRCPGRKNHFLNTGALLGTGLETKHGSCPQKDLKPRGGGAGGQKACSPALCSLTPVWGCPGWGSSWYPAGSSEDHGCPLAAERVCSGQRRLKRPTANDKPIPQATNAFLPFIQETSGRTQELTCPHLPGNLSSLGVPTTVNGGVCSQGVKDVMCIRCLPGHPSSSFHRNQEERWTGPAPLDPPPPPRHPTRREQGHPSSTPVSYISTLLCSDNVCLRSMSFPIPRLIFHFWQVVKCAFG